jgi:hypothetical protein
MTPSMKRLVSAMKSCVHNLSLPVDVLPLVKAQTCSLVLLEGSGKVLPHRLNHR